MSDGPSDTVEELREVFDGDWDEQAPMMGPPTYWVVREDWDDGNMMLSVNFSPMKDKTDAKLRYSSSNFTFSGELEVGGFAPVEAVTELVATFDKKLAQPLLERVLA